jgi:hypothetical protein
MSRRNSWLFLVAAAVVLATASPAVATGTLAVGVTAARLGAIVKTVSYTMTPLAVLGGTAFLYSTHSP